MHGVAVRLKQWTGTKNYHAGEVQLRRLCSLARLVIGVGESLAEGVGVEGTSSMAAGGEARG